MNDEKWIESKNWAEVYLIARYRKSIFKKWQYYVRSYKVNSIDELKEATKNFMDYFLVGEFRKVFRSDIIGYDMVTSTSEIYHDIAQFLNDEYGI